jgi:hypothetical protein
VDEVEGLDRHLEEGFQLDGRGAVDEDVEPAELLDGLGDGGLDGVVEADVAEDGDAFGAVLGCGFDFGAGGVYCARELGDNASIVERDTK